MVSCFSVSNRVVRLRGCRRRSTRGDEKGKGSQKRQKDTALHLYHRQPASDVEKVVIAVAVSYGRAVEDVMVRCCRRGGEVKTTAN
jgi:hypothetical protein